MSAHPLDSPPTTAAEVAHRRELLRLQLRSASAGKDVTCATCTCWAQSWRFFRCLECGLFLCPTCAKRHFAATAPTLNATPSTPPKTMPTPAHTTINQLAMLAALENSLVDAYSSAVEDADDPYVRQQLEECERSHQMRVDILREEIEDLDGEYDVESRDEDAALGEEVTGEAATIVELAKLEEYAIASYQRRLGPDAGIEFDVRDLISGDLLPEQERTQAIIASLKLEH